ncbi:calcium-binding protein [Leptothoe spongobia]|uniref:Calcium-binding protein n=1 Tax=Leptothoe spongobia TAU-MAC 1115 TaxID=1967444 RepID=A0A947DCF4_9CYAN|nr:hypothetical protein [Leptothoe spongobia]MBT9314438.1 hypothetical protein [Leptothoe spongobia TAU-MAC 1115]
MASTTLFMKPTGAVSYTPNYVRAESEGVAFSNYSLTTTDSLTNSETKALVKGGVATAISDAFAFFSGDSNFATIFGASEASGEGIDGGYRGSSSSETEVVVTFDVSDRQPLSFDFSTYIDLEAKEIENPDAEYNRATAKTAFLVLDTSQPKAKVLDYFGFRGRLVTSKQIGNIRKGKSTGIRTALSNIEKNLVKDVGGNNGNDFISADFSGTYEKTFKQDVSRVTIVQLTESETKFAGDTLIGNLGPGVIYGTIRRDKLHGTNRQDRIYGSLGNDRIYGRSGDDILEGGLGKDRLWGNAGNDKIHGGDGNDVIWGGSGSDLLAGGDDADTFVFNRLKAGEVDKILDFEVGTDKILVQGVDSSAVKRRLFQNITDTSSGAQFTSKTGGQVLFSGVTVAELGSADVLFA